MNVLNFGIRQRLLGLTLLALLPMTARAGSISAELNRTDGTTEDSFVLTLSIDGNRDGMPEVPAVKGLIINQQGVSESTSITNGQRTSELQVSYIVYAQEAGEFTIPSIKFPVDGKTEATLPLTLKVRAAANNGAGLGGGNSAGGQPPAANPKAGASAGNKPGGGKEKDAGGVLIERECDKSEVYVGEQLLCTVRILHRGNLRGGQRQTNSSAEFRHIAIEGEKTSQRMLNGQRYAVIELQEIVVPLKAGTQELPAYGIDARVLSFSKRNNQLDKFFDNFGGGVFNFDMGFTEEKQVELKTTPWPLKVKPLPESGKPLEFSGLVGAFTLAANVSQKQIKSGETVTVTIELSGNNVADMVPEPKLDLASIGRVYPDKPSYTEHTASPGGLQSQRTYKFALVPTKPGSYPLGTVKVPTFNPQSGQYENLQAELGTLIVGPKAAEEALVVGQSPVNDADATKDSGKSPVKTLGQDLILPHQASTLTAAQNLTETAKTVLLALGSAPPGLAFALLGLTEMKRRRLGKEPWSRGSRRSRAYRTFKEGAEAALARLSTGPDAGTLLAAYAGFRTYLGDKLGIHGSALAAREVEDLLLRLGLPEGEKVAAALAISRLESVSFSGKELAAAAATELIQTLLELAERVEKL